MSQLITINLSKSPGASWGFRLQGGKDFAQPLCIQKVNVGSLAESAGLQAGDAIVKIGGSDALSLRHKDAQDTIKNAGNSFQMVVQRGSMTWKPQVTALSQPKKTPEGPVATQTSLLAQQPPQQRAPKGFNAKPAAFGTTPSGQAIVNPAYNTPINLYNEENIAEALASQSEVLGKGCLGINFRKFDREVKLRTDSPTYQLIHGQDSGESQFKAHKQLPPPPDTTQTNKPLFPAPQPGQKGYYNINDKMYCDVHAKQAAKHNPPAPDMVPVTVKPGATPPKGAVAAPFKTPSDEVPPPAPIADEVVSSVAALNISETEVPPQPQEEISKDAPEEIGEKSIQNESVPIEQAADNACIAESNVEVENGEKHKEPVVDQSEKEEKLIQEVSNSEQVDKTVEKVELSTEQQQEPTSSPDQTVDEKIESSLEENPEVTSQPLESEVKIEVPIVEESKTNVADSKDEQSSELAMESEVPTQSEESVKPLETPTVETAQENSGKQSESEAVISETRKLVQEESASSFGPSPVVAGGSSANPAAFGAPSGGIDVRTHIPKKVNDRFAWPPRCVASEISGRNQSPSWARDGEVLKVSKPTHGGGPPPQSIPSLPTPPPAKEYEAMALSSVNTQQVQTQSNISNQQTQSFQSSSFQSKKTVTESVTVSNTSSLIEVKQKSVMKGKISPPKIVSVAEPLRSTTVTSSKSSSVENFKSTNQTQEQVSVDVPLDSALLPGYVPKSANIPGVKSVKAPVTVPKETKKTFGFKPVKPQFKTFAPSKPNQETSKSEQPESETKSKSPPMSNDSSLPFTDQPTPSVEPIPDVDPVPEITKVAPKEVAAPKPLVSQSPEPTGPVAAAPAPAPVPAPAPIFAPSKPTNPAPSFITPKPAAPPASAPAPSFITPKPAAPPASAPAPSFITPKPAGPPASVAPKPVSAPAPAPVFAPAPAPISLGGMPKPAPPPGLSSLGGMPKPPGSVGKGMSGQRTAPKRGRGVMTPAHASRIPICAGCQIQIRGPFVTALGKNWCPDHFHCATGSCCKQLIDVGFVEEQGQLYCEDCYEKYLAPTCGKCEKRIKGDCLNAVGKQFCPECFCCAYCGKIFGSGAFYLEDGLPYCETDWNDLFTTKCIGCGFPIEAGDRWVEALNNNYHSQCFKCSKCHKNLEGQSFFAKGGKPFCKSHAQRGL